VPEKLIRIEVRERGVAPRGMKRIINNATKEAYREMGEEFHRSYVDKRFTPKHAEAAGYTKRKGERQARGSKAFRRSYTGRKLSRFGHMNPLQFTGETRAAVRAQRRVSSTSKGVRVSYPGARVFNFQHPKSRVRMNEEFRRITPQESIELANYFDRRLDQRLANLRE
jgi:hypothetical protein